VIFYHNEHQKNVSEDKIQEIEDEGIWDNPIVTQIAPLQEFYPAEDYHQNYFKKNPFAGYCRAVISPKVLKFRARYTEQLRRG
jgi:peptide-methionine (S)-S-oxide reductase